MTYGPPAGPLTLTFGPPTTGVVTVTTLPTGATLAVVSSGTSRPRSTLVPVALSKVTRKVFGFGPAATVMLPASAGIPCSAASTAAAFVTPPTYVSGTVD